MLSKIGRGLAYFQAGATFLRFVARKILWNDIVGFNVYETCLGLVGHVRCVFFCEGYVLPSILVF